MYKNTTFALIVMTSTILKILLFLFNHSMEAKKIYLFIRLSVLVGSQVHYLIIWG